MVFSCLGVPLNKEIYWRFKSEKFWTRGSLIGIEGREDLVKMIPTDSSLSATIIAPSEIEWKEI
jgi:hypothetical protein